HKIQPNQLTIPERERYLLLGAQANLQQDQGEQALQLLGQAVPPLFSNTSLETQQQLSELRATAYLVSNDPLLSALERVFAAGLLSGDAYDRNHELIWSALARVPTNELQHALEEAVEGDLKGWLDLRSEERRVGKECRAGRPPTGQEENGHGAGNRSGHACGRVRRPAQAA